MGSTFMSHRIIKSLTISLLFVFVAPVHGIASNFNPIAGDKHLIKVWLTLGVIWEGQDMLNHNLEALREIRENLSGISIIQFLNPAYLTKPQVNANQIVQKIKYAIRTDDIIGLHVHPWRSLTKSAGVEFRKQPTFWGNQGSQANTIQDWGHEVPLSIYTEEEIIQLIKHSQSLFSQHGLQAPSVFMAGGWMAAPHVLEAVRKSEVLYDASAINMEVIRSRLGNVPLYSWLSNIWGSMKFPYQPFLLQTERGNLRQIVLNGGIPDYNKGDEIIERFLKMINYAQETGINSFHFHLAIYQETAWDTKRSLFNTIKQLKVHAASQNIKLTEVERLQDLFPEHNDAFEIQLSVQ